MAVAALLSNAISLLACGSHHGLHHTPMASGPEAATQTFKRGAPLVNSSGYLAIAAADVTSGIIGIAAENAHNDAAAGRMISYIPAKPGVVFEGTLEDQSNESHVLAVTNRFAKYALQVDNNGIWYLDENDTSNTSVLVEAFKDPVGTIRGRVLFSFDISNTIYG